MLAGRQLNRFSTMDKMLLCAFSHAHNQVLWCECHHRSLFPGEETKSARPPAHQRAAEVWFASAFWFVRNLCHRPPLHGKSSQAVEAQTPGQALARPFEHFRGYPHRPTHLLLADVEANKNTSAGSNSTPTAGSRDQVTYPQLWESSTTPTCALGKGTIFHGFVFKKINVWPFSGAEWDAPSNVWFNKLTLSFELCHRL